MHEKSKAICDLGRAVVATELATVEALKSSIDDNFVKACELLLACTGKIIVMGMGKSGHIGKKIASTLASTGSPAFFVHPAEASHGDAGMMSKDDVVLMLSNSGETSELLTIVENIKRLNIPLISLSGSHSSTLASAATVNIAVLVEQEACPLGLAPTASTTAMLVMGDALAIALLDNKGFTADDFAVSHPGGTLGRRLLLRVEKIMRTGDDLPYVTPDMILQDVLRIMTDKGLGVVLILDDNKKLLGIFTDGDVRRKIMQGLDFTKAKVGEVMTTNPKVIDGKMLAAEALDIMEDNSITSLVVTKDKQLVGIIHMHDLLKVAVI